MGEEVTLKFIPDLITNTYWQNTWSTTAGSVAPAAAISTTFTAPSNASPATVTATVGDEKLDVPFSVYEPSGFDHARIRSTTAVAIPPGTPGASMDLDVYIGPTNVSFYRVEIWEQGTNASGLLGYFLEHGAPSHNSADGANMWHPVGCNNKVTHGNFDRAELYGNPALSWRPLYDGRFTWDIPAKWRIPGGPTNPMAGWNQVFILTNSSTMRIEKFDTSVTRTINNYITPLL